MRLFLLIIAAVLSGLFYVGITSIVPINGGNNFSEQTRPIAYDAYAEGINTTLFDETGDIDYTLVAERQVHYNEDVTELDAPIITLFENGNRRWNISADSGRIFTGANTQSERQSVDTIELMGNVEVTGIDQLGNTKQLLSEFMLVDPNLETLESDQRVRMISQGQDMTGLGMFADLNKDEISLHADVKGSYVRPN